MTMLLLASVFCLSFALGWLASYLVHRNEVRKMEQRVAAHAFQVGRPYGFGLSFF